MKRQQSTVRSLIRPVLSIGLLCPLHPQEVHPEQDGVGWVGLCGRVYQSGSLASMASGSQAQLSPGQQAEKWGWIWNLESVTRSQETLGRALGQTRKRAPEWGFYGAEQDSGQGENQYLSSPTWAELLEERKKGINTRRKEEASKNKQGNYLAWDLKPENYNGKIGWHILNWSNY